MPADTPNSFSPESEVTERLGRPQKSRERNTACQPGDPPARTTPEPANTFSTYSKVNRTRPTIEGERFLRIPEVCRMVGYSRASLYRLEAAGQFPRRVKLGANSIAWRLSDVRRWMDSRQEASA